MTGILAGTALLAGAWLGWFAVLLVAAVAAVVWLLTAPAGGSRAAVILVLLAALTGAARHQPLPSPPTPLWIDRVEAVRGIVRSNPRHNEASQTFTLRMTETYDGHSWSVQPGDLCVVARPTPRVSLDDHVWMPGSASAITDEPSRYRSGLLLRGCVAGYFATTAAVDTSGSSWQRRLAESRDAATGLFERMVPGDEGALMSGLVTGDDSGLSDQRQDAFVATASSHITAVSGANFALLLTVFVAAGGRMGIRRRGWWIAFVCAGVWGYALFTGLAPPAFRAAIVASLALAAVSFGRRPDALTLTVLSAASMVAFDPVMIWRLSFLLSLSSTLALATLADFSAGAGWRKTLASAVLATMAAQLATLPFLLPINNMVSVSGLPANIAIAPLVELAFPTSVVAGLLGWIWFPLGRAVSLPAEMTCGAILTIVDWFARNGAVVQLGLASPGALLVVALAMWSACFALSADAARVRKRLPELREVKELPWLLWGGATGCLLAIVGRMLMARV